MSRNPFPNISIWFVLSANLFAVLMAVTLNWRLNDLFTLYWLELVALAGITLWQMRRASAAGAFQKSRGYLVILFLTHYGTFCVMYRAALVSAFGLDADSAGGFWFIVWIPLLTFIAAHLVSLRRDYLPHQAPAYAPFDAMWIPYRRELPVHAPLALSVVLFSPDTDSRNIVLAYAAAKTVLDIAVHVLYHTKLARTR